VEPFHLSFPNVFSSDGILWMVPESSEAKKLFLYKFDEASGKFQHHHTLLDLACYDPVLLVKNGIHYIWTTDEAGFLRLFFADKLTDKFSEHPKSPLSTDPRYNRNAGPIAALANGDTMRLAQDGSLTYGQAVHVFRITDLSPTEYKEVLVKKDIVPKSSWWSADGAHHLSMVHYQGKKIIARDGYARGSFINNCKIFTVRVLAYFYRVNEKN
jgi:hypothetical protein